ncbi:MAG: hypothetical protein AB7J28_02000 [Hyphomonadaceae bacterium]
MKFYVPGAQNAQQSEELYQGICKYIGAPISDPSDRVWGVKWRHNDHEHHAKVDRTLDGYKDTETVLAIIEVGDEFAVCTRSHGVLEGKPMMAPRQDVIELWKFHV